KNQDASKHRDTKSMDRYDCNRMIIISINHTTLIATIYIRYHLLYPYPKDVSISDDIKQFIMNNIDLLPHKIMH
ncbi:28760_t:CDS:1, partial [Gigaspora margarita]